MEHRREPRLATDQPVVLIVLTEPSLRMTARVKNFSGRGLGLVAPQPVPCGAAVRIEMEDAIVLGEAVHCAREAGGHFIGIKVDQVLAGLKELARKLAAFREEAPVPRCESPPDGVGPATSACGPVRNLP